MPPGGTVARLPREMWHHVLGYCNLPQLCLCQLVCRAWRASCGGHWARFLLPPGPTASAPPDGPEALAALCFRGRVRHNASIPRFRSGVVGVAPPAYHVALTDRLLFAADDGQAGLAAYGANLTDVGLPGIAHLGVLPTHAVVTCVASSGSLVACATSDGCLCAWALGDLRPAFRRRLPLTAVTVYQIAFGPATSSPVLVTASVNSLGPGQHVTVVDARTGTPLAVVGYGDDVVRVYVPPVPLADGAWVVVQLSHALHWWRITAPAPGSQAKAAEDPGAGTEELRHGKVEFRAPGVAFALEDRLALQAVPVAVAGSLADPTYAVVLPQTQVLLLRWPTTAPTDAPPVLVHVQQDLVHCDLIHKVCFSSHHGHLFGSFAEENGRIGVFTFLYGAWESPLPPDGPGARPPQMWAKHCWLPDVRGSPTPAEAFGDVTCIAADDFLARVFVLCASMQLHIVDSVSLLTLSVIQCFEPGRKGPLQGLPAQVQVRGNLVVVHPLPGHMQESNTLLLDFQPADAAICHQPPNPPPHRRSLELLRRCWEFKYRSLREAAAGGDGAEGEVVPLLSTGPLGLKAPSPPAPDDGDDSVGGGFQTGTPLLTDPPTEAACDHLAEQWADESGSDAGTGAVGAASSSAGPAPGTPLPPPALAAPTSAAAAGLVGPLDPDRLHAVLHGLAALEKPGLVVLRSTQRHRLGHLPYALGSLLMAAVLLAAGCLLDGHSLPLPGGARLRWAWLIGPHCLAMLTHLWFAYPHLDYFLADRSRGAELEFTTLQLPFQCLHFLTTLASHILLPVLVLLKLDGHTDLHWAWLAACFQVRYIGRLLLYGWQWRRTAPVRRRFPGLYGEGLAAAAAAGGAGGWWQANTACFAAFAFLLAFWLEGDLRVPVAAVFTPIWVSLALMGVAEWLLPHLARLRRCSTPTPSPPATPPGSEEAPRRGPGDHAVFCVVLYIIPLLALYLRLTDRWHIPSLLVLAPHILFLSVSFAYCTYSWSLNASA